MHLEGGPAYGLGQGRVGVGGGEGDQDLHGARVADGAYLVEERGTVACTADSRWRTSSGASPWSATAAAVSTHSQVASSRVRTSWRVLGVGALVLGEPQQGVRPQGRLVDDGAHVGLGGGADDAQRLEGEAAQQGVLAAGGVEQFGDGAADGAGGEPGAVLGAGRVRA